MTWIWHINHTSDMNMTYLWYKWHEYDIFMIQVTWVIMMQLPESWSIYNTPLTPLHVWVLDGVKSGGTESRYAWRKQIDRKEVQINGNYLLFHVDCSKTDTFFFDIKFIKKLFYEEYLIFLFVLLTRQIQDPGAIAEHYGVIIW